jgi:hypothetical protein
MARGIISTILGGVAGGLEGRERQYLRTREEEERRLAREAEAAQREFMNQATLTQMGATPGARLREDFASQAQSRMDQRDGALSRALDSTPVAPPEAAGSATGRGLESAVGRAFQTAQIAPQRERFVPQVQDPDYFEMQTPGGQLFSMETPEARVRREDERQRTIAEESADAASSRATKEDQQRFEELLAMGASREQAMEAVYGIRQQRLESGQPRPALVETVEYLKTVYPPDTPIQDLVRIARGSSVEERSGEDALKEHMLRFMSNRPAFPGQRGSAPSEMEMREEALRAAPLLGVSRDAVDRLFPSRGGLGEYMINPGAFPGFSRSREQTTGSTREPTTNLDLSQLTTEELERLARGGG